MDRNKVIQALDIAQCELRAMYKRNGIINSNALRMVDEAYFEVKNCSIPIVMPSLFKERRLKLNLSMQDVTNQTDISKATISRIERGNDAFYDTVMKLDKFYTDNGA